MQHQIAIRCADGKTIYMKAGKSVTTISGRNIIAGIMLGTSLLASALVAYACL